MDGAETTQKGPTSASDEFKWFGEGFSGFPKRLPDDCVEYTIFIIDSKLRGGPHQDFERRERLKKIQTKSIELLKSPLLKEYIWQRDRFSLDLIDTKLRDSNEDTKEDPVIPHRYHLHGRTNFGDSIADEWLIVWLLLELSKAFPTAWIQVRDSDGEFLLVEAANALPKWLEPELADNRVWLNRGQLRIVPLARDAGVGVGPRTPGLPGEVKVAQALEFIEASEKSVLHSPLIEAEAFHRLNDFPGAVDASQHHALLRIPRRLAFLLHENPAYVAPAIEAFYLRDPIAVKPLATKDTATLLFPPEDFVSVSVRFPKVGYAQLHSQEFGVPAAWVGVKPHLGEKAVSMGMKLCCGFEMLLRDPQNRNKREVREMQVLLEDADEDESVLPSASDIAGWERRVDNDGWLDIDFKDFEKELGGKTAAEGRADAETQGDGFGDPATQDNLRNMVSRFEKFMNDDDAGPEGARFSDASSDTGSGSEDDDDDDDDDDNDENEDSDPDSEGEDKAASFSDAEFERAMREMMGMPEEQKQSSGITDEARKLALEMEEEEEMERDEEKEAQEIIKLMEKKLKAKGASNGDNANSSKDDPEERKGKTVNFDADVAGAVRAKGKGKGKAKVLEDPLPLDSDSSDDDEDVVGDVDYNLLKNMLESFKGQAGMAGPTSNLLGLMGLKMPRDEGAEGEEKRGGGRKGGIIDDGEDDEDED